MSILLNGFDYGTAAGNIINQAIVDPPWNFQQTVQTFWSVRGAQENSGEQTHRILTLTVDFLGFATETLLREHVELVQDTAGSNGTLVVDGVSWPLSEFRGYVPKGQPFLDVSGQNGVHQSGTLRYLQIKSPAAPPAPPPP